MAHVRRTLGIAAVCLVLGHVLSAQTRPERMMADGLFSVYSTRGPVVVAEAIGSMQQFERFRSDFETRVFPAWRVRRRTALQSMFMLEVAIATGGEPHRYPGWEHFLTLGGRFLADRPEPPGTDEAADAFETLWHQTAVAFLDGLQNPSLRDLVGIQPLAGRFASVAPGADSAAVLVVPWVELARGVSLELISIDHPEALDVLGPSALDHYRLAMAAGGPARAEAALRSAHLLTRLGRAVEALGTLAGFEDDWTTDVTYRYWHRLLRGRAYDALGHADNAILAYEDALRIMPSAQAPRIAMAAVYARQHRSADVLVQLDALGHGDDTSADPWSAYRDADARFFQQRLAALREASRR